MDEGEDAPGAAGWARNYALMRRLQEEVNTEFEEDDPRRGPFSLIEIAEAELRLHEKGRWHVRQRGVDWLAVRLQFGRGRPAQQVGWMFGIGDSTISNRKRGEKWADLMSEDGRRELARLVWIAGIARMAKDDAASRAALVKASEWRMPQDRTPAKWQEKDKGGAPITLTINDEIPHDFYYSDADPKRDDRIEMRDRLDHLLARMERDVARGKTRPDEDVVQELAGDEGRVVGPEADRASMADLGERGPASA